MMLMEKVEHTTRPVRVETVVHSGMLLKIIMGALGES
jgi:hypothetical protein